MCGQTLVRQVAARLESALDRWHGQCRATNLKHVLEGLEGQGLTPALHEAILDHVLVKGSWAKQVDRWHRPFIEVPSPAPRRRSSSGFGVRVLGFGDRASG